MLKKILAVLRTTFCCSSDNYFAAKKTLTLQEMVLINQPFAIFLWLLNRQGSSFRPEEIKI